MDVDTKLLISIFLCPHSEGTVSVQEFLQRVNDAASPYLAQSVARGLAQPQSDCIIIQDNHIIGMIWRKHPLRFEIVNETNFRNAHDSIAYDELEMLRSKRSQLQQQLAESLSTLYNKKEIK